jgi:hypothetical protein
MEKNMEQRRVKITANEVYSAQYGRLAKGDIVVTDRSGGQHLVDELKAGTYEDAAKAQTENTGEATGVAVDAPGHTHPQTATETKFRSGEPDAATDVQKPQSKGSRKSSVVREDDADE